MFKGLRNKIESEAQNILVNNTQVPPTAIQKSNTTAQNLISRPHCVPDPNDVDPISITKNNLHQVTTTDRFSKNVLKNHDTVSNTSLNNLEQINQDLREELEKLKAEVNLLAKERDESNDQNAQLYQLVEKLRRNLESEKETNADLLSRIAETEATSKTNSEEIEELKRQKEELARDSSKIKSNETDVEDFEVMKARVSKLQDQLSERTKALKLRQHNLNDLKKTLQREILEHSKTQDKLNKLISEQNDQLNLETLSVAETDADTKSDTKSNQPINQETYDSGTNHTNINRDIDPIGPGAMTPQFDAISHCSRSSTSVNDFDFNDLPQKNSSRDVNHEYLKNVLFRYMTSNDSDTTKHLVKALSVIMNFSPEQCSAIRKSMNNRSSWLRLR